LVLYYLIMINNYIQLINKARYYHNLYKHINVCTLYRSKITLEILFHIVMEILVLGALLALKTLATFIVVPFFVACIIAFGPSLFIYCLLIVAHCPALRVGHVLVSLTTVLRWSTFSNHSHRIPTSKSVRSQSFTTKGCRACASTCCHTCLLESPMQRHYVVVSSCNFARTFVGPSSSVLFRDQNYVLRWFFVGILMPSFGFYYVFLVYIHGPGSTAYPDSLNP